MYWVSEGSNCSTGTAAYPLGGQTDAFGNVDVYIDTPGTYHLCLVENGVPTLYSHVKAIVAAAPQAPPGLPPPLPPSSPPVPSPPPPGIDIGVTGGGTPDPDPSTLITIFSNETINMQIGGLHPLTPGEEVYWVPQNSSCDDFNATAPRGGILDNFKNVQIRIEDPGVYFLCTIEEGIKYPHTHITVTVVSEVTEPSPPTPPIMPPAPPTAPPYPMYNEFSHCYHREENALWGLFLTFTGVSYAGYETLSTAMDACANLFTGVCTGIVTSDSVMRFYLRSGTGFAPSSIYNSFRLDKVPCDPICLLYTSPSPRDS